MNHAPLLDRHMTDALRVAHRVAVLTGAGCSAESGIPTFRDKQTGLWERYDAMELATPEAFQRDPALVWGWYEWRRAAVLAAQPNAGHRALAALALRVPQCTLITQNVDDLHERAGSSDVAHLHGELSRPYCESCRAPHAHPAGIPRLPPGGARLEPPRCGACGGRIRPGVVWFGEGLPARQWQAALEAARHCDVFFCIGTSSMVQPAASLLDLAIGAGARTIQVNIDATHYDRSVGLSIRGMAGAVLPRIVAETWQSTAKSVPG